MSATADLIVYDANVTTLDGRTTEAQAFAVVGEMFVAVGNTPEVMRFRGDQTVVIDAGGRRVIPGLNDSHLHAVRGGLNYNLELRWDGVDSLKRGLAMIREQAGRTPKDQWVRVMGGWSPHQFKERRMPSVAELTEAAPDTAVFVLFGYSEVLINDAGARALKYTSLDGKGTSIVGSAEVYAAIARLPMLDSPDDQLNSTAQFFNELNRFGLTSIIDAGASGIAYPENYQSVATLASRPKFPVRISNFLFAPKPGTELERWRKWSVEEQRNLNHAAARLNGYVLEGAGEVLVWDAHDFENFMAPRPTWGPQTKQELTAVVRVIAAHQWPIRMHATYDETITELLDVFEQVFKETNYTARWAIDHAETISPRNIARIKALGGGIAVQDRMAFAGEYFAERYGAEVAANAPPLRRIVDAGVPVGGGTDATRVASYNPWLSLYWMVTGRTVGGTSFGSEQGRLTREEALRAYTVGSAWFSHEENEKGRIAAGQLADFAILSADYLSVPEEQIRSIESVLTVTGGDVVYAADPFASLRRAPLPPVSPSWSPVAVFGGYHQAGNGGSKRRGGL
jgi:predicted amidohydrolase YtcJ